MVLLSIANHIQEGARRGRGGFQGRPACMSFAPANLHIHCTYLNLFMYTHTHTQGP